jgi:hypothetical protein
LKRRPREHFDNAIGNAGEKCPVIALARAFAIRADLTCRLRSGKESGYQNASAAWFQLHQTIRRSYFLQDGPLSAAL